MHHVAKILALGNLQVLKDRRLNEMLCLIPRNTCRKFFKRFFCLRWVELFDRRSLIVVGNAQLVGRPIPCFSGIPAAQQRHRADHQPGKSFGQPAATAHDSCADSGDDGNNTTRLQASAFIVDVGVEKPFGLFLRYGRRSFLFRLRCSIIFRCGFAIRLYFFFFLWCVDHKTFHLLSANGFILRDKPIRQQLNFYDRPNK